MTQEEIISMARESGFRETDAMFRPVYISAPSDIERFAKLVAEKERAEVDRLKALCEEMLSELYVYRASEYLKDVTAAIRARGNK